MIKQAIAAVLFILLYKLYKRLRPERERWLSGLVQCDLCAKEWIAVRPEGVPQLQCPNCENIVNYTVISPDDTNPRSN